MLSNPNSWPYLHEQRLKDIAYKWTKNIHDAENLVQETFLSAFESRDEYKEMGAERAWFFRILQHKYYQWVEKKVYSKISLVDDLATIVKFGCKGLFTKPDLIEIVSSNEFLNFVKHVSKKITFVNIQAFMKKETEHKSTLECCRELRSCLKTFRTRYYRGRQQLRFYCEVYWDR